MIDLPQLRIGILTPPKCATHTLHAVFCAPPWNGQTIVAATPSNPQRLDRHVRQWPNELAGHRKLVAVRHPLDRLVSLFLHFTRFEAAHGRGTPNFNNFCRWVAGIDRPRDFSPQLLYHWTLSQWLEGTAWDALLRVEHLADDLAREGLKVAGLPRENTSYYARPWRDFYDAERLSILEPWARLDCERFGYDWAAVTGQPTAPG